mgnify:CR=1 FL=1
MAGCHLYGGWPCGHGTGGGTSGLWPCCRKDAYKWIVNAEEKFGSGAGAEKKAHVIAVLRGYTPDWLDWAINERTLDWIVQIVFNFTKKKLEDYMEKKSAETTTVAHFGNVGEDNKNRKE